MKQYFTFSYALLSKIGIYPRCPLSNALSKFSSYNMLFKGFAEVAFLKQWMNRVADFLLCANKK